MTWEKTRNVCFVVFLLMFGLAQIAQAGFGISPPYVKNENLTQGSHYEKNITLVRGDPIEDWEVEIITNVPGADDWISVGQGKNFTMPQGVKQVPILIKIDVPDNAKFGRYIGSIRVKTAPIKDLEQGTISILLGGQIDVNLNVAKDVFDFQVMRTKISDLETGHKSWIFSFPGIIKFSMQVKNIGNIKAAPSKVSFEIYDEKEENILEKTETTKMENTVKPFETDWVTANLQTQLKPGSYYAQYKVFKKDEIVSTGKIHLSILSQGSIIEYKGASILDLSLKDKLIMILFGLLGLGALAGMGYGGYKGYGVWKKRALRKIK